MQREKNEAEEASRRGDRLNEMLKQKGAEIEKLKEEHRNTVNGLRQSIRELEATAGPMQVRVSSEEHARLIAKTWAKRMVQVARRGTSTGEVMWRVRIGTDGPLATVIDAKTEEAATLVAGAVEDALFHPFFGGLMELVEKVGGSSYDYEETTEEHVIGELTLKNLELEKVARRAQDEMSALKVELLDRTKRVDAVHERLDKIEPMTSEAFAQVKELEKKFEDSIHKYETALKAKDGLIARLEEDKRKLWAGNEMLQEVIRKQCAPEVKLPARAAGKRHPSMNWDAPLRHRRLTSSSHRPNPHRWTEEEIAIEKAATASAGPIVLREPNVPGCHDVINSVWGIDAPLYACDGEASWKMSSIAPTVTAGPRDEVVFWSIADGEHRLGFVKWVGGGFIGIDTDPVTLLNAGPADVRFALADRGRFWRLVRKAPQETTSQTEKPSLVTATHEVDCALSRDGTTSYFDPTRSLSIGDLVETHADVGQVFVLSSNEEGSFDCATAQRLDGTRFRIEIDGRGRDWRIVRQEAKTFPMPQPGQRVVDRRTGEKGHLVSFALENGAQVGRTVLPDGGYLFHVQTDEGIRTCTGIEQFHDVWRCIALPSMDPKQEKKDEPEMGDYLRSRLDGAKVYPIVAVERQYVIYKREDGSRGDIGVMWQGKSWDLLKRPKRGDKILVLAVFGQSPLTVVNPDPSDEWVFAERGGHTVSVSMKTQGIGWTLFRKEAST